MPRPWRSSSSMVSTLSLRPLFRRALFSGNSVLPISYTHAPEIRCFSPKNTRLYVSGPPSSVEASPESLRNIMRKIPHPVVIVTSGVDSSPASWRGITLSSFNCFSLNPHPLVSFNIKTPSSAASTMAKAGKFAVHIFRPSPRSAFLASQFSRIGAVHSSEVSPFSFAKGKVMLADVGSNTGPPLLGRDDDVLFRLHCETFRTVQIEDHQLWVGKVQRVDVVGDVKDIEGVGAEEVFSLMYSDRHFRHVGRALIPAETGGEREDPGSVDGDMDDGSLAGEEHGSISGSGRQIIQ